MSEIKNIYYAANGIDHSLQRRVTDFMHELCMGVGEFTLANLGYLHVNTLCYDIKSQEILMKLYFDARLALVPMNNMVSGGRVLVPRPEFNIFSGSLFVGDISQTYSTEEIHALKGKIGKDELGRDALYLNKEKMVLTDAMVIKCCYPIAMAALHNISLRDPNYMPRGKAIASPSKNDMAKIASNISNPVVPMEVSIEFTPGFGDYSDADINWYLAKCNGTLEKSQENQKRIIEEVKKRSKKNKKKTTNFTKGFIKNS